MIKHFEKKLYDFFKKKFLTALREKKQGSIEDFKFKNIALS